MTDISVLLQNVTKRYYLEKPRTLKKWFQSLFSPYEKLTVIKSLSLKVNKGEFILIQGPNGCGKSTLLKLIAGITIPDEGNIKTYGRIVPLIELGAGFNFDLTGRENIMINASILGIHKPQINHIIPHIIEFSGLKEFIDFPIKRYSTGMVSRLAFSIAVFSNPDILLLDEVFSVGDKDFRKKCINELKKFKKKNVTILLCSHGEMQNNLIDRQINLSKNIK